MSSFAHSEPQDRLSPADRCSGASHDLQDGNDPHTLTFGQLSPGSSSCAGFHPPAHGNRVTGALGQELARQQSQTHVHDTSLGGTSLHVPGTQPGIAFWKHLLSSEHRPGSLSNHLCTYLQWPKRNKVARDNLKARIVPTGTLILSRVGCFPLLLIN